MWMDELKWRAMTLDPDLGSAFEGGREMARSRIYMAASLRFSATTTGIITKFIVE